MLLDERTFQEVHGARDLFLMIRPLSTFEMLNDENVLWLAEHCRQRFFRKGTVLQIEGEPIRHGNIVMRGRIRVVRKGIEVAVVQRGFGVGFLSILAHDENGIHAETMEDTVTLQFPTEALFAAYEADFSFLRNAIRNLSRSLVKARGNLPTRDGVQPPIEEGTLRHRPMTLVERILIMKDAGVFAGKNLDAIIDVARRQEEVRFAPDTVVWTSGEPALFSLRTEYGQYECTGPDGRTVIIGANFVLGALDVFADEPRHFTVRTLTEAVGLKMSRDVFMAVLESHRDLATDLARGLARNLLEKS